MPLLAAVLAAPTAALAGSPWHPANNDAGFTFHPDHSTSTKTRAEVLKELEEAKADGSYDYLQRGLPVPSRDTGPGKTREEVINELVNMTPEARAHERALFRRLTDSSRWWDRVSAFPAFRRCMTDDPLWRPSHVFPFRPIARASAK